MQVMKLVRWSLVTVLVLVALLVGLSAAVVLLEITINLNAFKGKVESAASTALGRTVTLEGPLELVPSLWPISIQHLLFGDIRREKIIHNRLESALIKDAVVP